MFEANNIAVRAGARAILDDVSLALQPGEVVALLGANGAGKSTLLKTFCGDVRPAAGEVRLENRPLADWGCHELARRRAVLSQHAEMNFPFTAREVALLGRSPHVRGRESEKDRSIVDEALRLVDAAPLADQSYPTLSGGERQRVQLARVLAQIWERPAAAARYLFLDEPTASLDLAHQHLTLRLARRFAARETAVLVVLHDLSLAAQYADRIMILHRGRNYACGTPSEVLTRAAIREVFAVDAYIMRRTEPGSAPLIFTLGAVPGDEKVL